ncbi:hypothetical protein EA462_02665 [Natrarchaeobius halalkaliphilus]|uniref:RCK C-terminal domain-containing protein n=1 Tax=Natrarchaeobius halalkaliphilus TaxID=1679091 RepID=A0A3N6LZ13_9EURY|nr:TrkA C-terminal domain-containing protein [Natrarchaeobius halalkaliphilus]RQG93124.1 hypothetical protein EA462_02665 [Natrarchaeobius halalkaliphilus]
MIATATQVVVTEWTVTALLNVFGFGLLASVAGATIAFGYRRYSTRPAPLGVGILIGIGVVGVWLNGVGLQQTTVIDETPLFHHATATYFLGAFVVGAVGADGGRRIGDALARDVFEIRCVVGSNERLTFARSARLSIAVDLPGTVGDLAGYPPVDEAVKQSIAGETVLFPHDLSDTVLESRLERHIEREYDVDYARVTLETNGTVEHVLVGRRPAGIGSTVPPGSVAVCVRADPPGRASAGDPIELWSTEKGSTSLRGTGTLRATTDESVTVSLEEDVAGELDVETRYRLVIRPTASSQVYELASVLRATDETIVSVSVTVNGPLETEFVGWLPGTVLVLHRDGEVIPFPRDRVTLEASDELYVLGTPSELRLLEETEKSAS